MPEPSARPDTNSRWGSVLLEHALAQQQMSRLPAGSILSWVEQTSSRVTRREMAYWVAQTLAARGEHERGGDGIATAIAAEPAAAANAELRWRMVALAVAPGNRPRTRNRKCYYSRRNPSTSDVDLRMGLPRGDLSRTARSRRAAAAAAVAGPTTPWVQEGLMPPHESARDVNRTLFGVLPLLTMMVAVLAAAAEDGGQFDEERPPIIVHNGSIVFEPQLRPGAPPGSWEAAGPTSVWRHIHPSKAVPKALQVTATPVGTSARTLAAQKLFSQPTDTPITIASGSPKESQEAVVSILNGNLTVNFREESARARRQDTAAHCLRQQ